VAIRWDVEQSSLQSISGRPSYSYVDGELRKVARDAYIDWQGNRYSVPWQYVGKEVWVRELAGKWMSWMAVRRSQCTPERDADMKW
jgi:hypothetical protein